MRPKCDNCGERCEKMHLNVADYEKFCPLCFAAFAKGRIGILQKFVRPGAKKDGLDWPETLKEYDA